MVLIGEGMGGGGEKKQKGSLTDSHTNSQAIQNNARGSRGKWTEMYSHAHVVVCPKERKGGEGGGNGNRLCSPNHVAEQPLCGPVASRFVVRLRSVSTQARNVVVAISMK